MKKILLFIILNISLNVFAFDVRDLPEIPEDLTLVCGIKHSDGSKQILVYIKNGVLIDYRGNVDFKNVDSGVGLLNGQIVGFADRQFVLSRDFKSLQEGTTFQALDGCAISIEDFHQDTFVNSL